jgi:hypothetical protein
MIEWLLHTFDPIAPQLQVWAAMLGKIPAGTVTVAALIALYMFRGKIAHVIFVLPGIACGLAMGWWVWSALGWHPLIAAIAGMLVSAGVFQILSHFLYVRIAIAAIAWPIAVLALWHLARGALDLWWALAITGIGSWTAGSLLRRLVNTENQELYVWAMNLYDDLRGD